MEKIKNQFLFSLLVFSFLFILMFHATKVVSAFTSKDGLESWGYVKVRPMAHMFWWHYKSPNRIEDPKKPWPIILWLQGGPGGSGVAIGNFEEIGPLDTDLKPRNSTWLQIADLLFVDNPVGTGYSFVEDTSLLVKTDVEAANDMTTLLITIFNNKNETLLLQNSPPLYIFSESYGGKFAVTLGLAVHKAIESRKLKLQLGGVVLGDSWISPEDFTSSWGPLLNDVSRLDDTGLQKSNIFASQIKQQIATGELEKATNTWEQLQHFISENSNSVDFYNFLLDSRMDPIAAKRYAGYLSILRSSSTPGNVDDLMKNGAIIRKKLKIIPQNVTWGGQSGDVFNALAGDFMRPRIAEVDELLEKGVNVTIYNGQFDLICATKGTEAWLQKLKWDGLKSFQSLDRTPIYCGNDLATKGFTKSYKNLHFYWVLGAGHFVPVDQPCVALSMVQSITQSPAAITVL